MSIFEIAFKCTVVLSHQIDLIDIVVTEISQSIFDCAVLSAKTSIVALCPHYCDWYQEYRTLWQAPFPFNQEFNNVGIFNEICVNLRLSLINLIEDILHFILYVNQLKVSSNEINSLRKLRDILTYTYIDLYPIE